MADPTQELLELQTRVADLTRRLYRLEQVLGQTEVPRPDPHPPPPEKRTIPTAFSLPKIASAAREIDLESRIGSQWLNRIGVIALLIGIAYFLKLAFDSGWIGPAGRVSIGMLLGIGLVTWSSRLHARGAVYFSYSLAAVGLGAMYLSLWAAFQLYHLLPAPVAFGAMILVTGSAAALALRLDAQIITAVAIAGGFATPALLSTGQNRPFELFGYIALLDVATMALVAIKPWRRLLLASFIGTASYYLGWHASFFSSNQRDIALSFATLFFVLFAILPVMKRFVPQFGEGTDWAYSKTFISVALLNPVIYFLQLWAIFDGHPFDEDILAGAAVALGAVYIVLSRSLPATEKASVAAGRQFQNWLHIAVAIGFLTVAIPIKLEGHWITMAWLVESAVLLYVSNRANSDFLRVTAIVALSLGIFRLLVIDNFYPERLIFNERMASYAIAVIVLALLAREARRLRPENLPVYLIITVTLNVLALVALSHEVADHFSRSYVAGNRPGFVSTIAWNDIRTARDFAYSALFMIYGAGLLAYGFAQKVAALRWQALVLILATIAKVFLYDLGNLTGVFRVLSFIALGVLLMAVSYIYQKGWLKLSDQT